MQHPEQTLIIRCKELIEQKLGWRDSRYWTQRDFEYLSELIFEAAHIRLSISTLKRIWTKFPEHRPHPSTLNALAIFLDYDHWLDFKKNVIENIPHYLSKAKTDRTGTTVSEEKNDAIRPSTGLNRWIKTGHPLWLIVIPMILIISTACYVLLNRFVFQGSHEDVLFTSKKVVTNGVPNTIIFNYDISKIKSNNVQIQQSWDPNRRVRISKVDSQHTSVYYYPGYHKAKLVINDKIIKQHHIHITTDGWSGLARNDLNAPIPFYIPKKDIIAGSMLYVSPDILRVNKVNLSENSYWVSFYNVQDFGPIDGDNFGFKSQVRNNLTEGGLTGQYVLITMMCQNGRTFIPLTIPGCVGNISVKFQDVLVEGNKNDLSAFGCDLSQWNEIQCDVKNRIAKIRLNGKLIFELSYRQPAGRIIGMQFMFYGCGAVDYVKLWNENNTVIYEEDFKI